MRKLLISILLVVALATTVRAQFRLVSDGFVSQVSNPNDSTYVVDITFFSDLTGSGYNPLGIQVGYQVFSQRGQLYTVSEVNNLTFSSGQLTIIEVDNSVVNTDGLPIGQVQVYDPGEVKSIPQVPFGTTGATSVLQAAVVSYNSRISNSLPTDSTRLVSDSILVYYQSGSEVGRDTLRGLGGGGSGGVTSSQLADTSSSIRADIPTEAEIINTITNEGFILNETDIIALGAIADTSSSIRADIPNGYTLYVAASDTPPQLAKIAKYRCDGTNDRAEIIAAADELGSRGGKVFFLPGTYNVHTLPLRNGLFYEGSGSSQNGSSFGTRLVLDNSTGETSLFIPENNIAVFYNGGIENMTLQGNSQSTDIAVNLRTAGSFSSRMENFQFSGNYVTNFKYGWLGGSKERANNIENNFFRTCRVAIYCGEHPRISNNDIRSCLFGIVNPFDALIWSNKIINNAVGIGDINQRNGSGHNTIPATVSDSTITAPGAFVSAGLDLYVVFINSGNAYSIVSANGNDQVDVLGDPSGETGDIVVTGFGVGSNNISDCIYSSHTIADVILSGDNQYSNNRHLSNTIQDYPIGLFVRGNNNFISGLKYEAQGASGYTRGLIELGTVSFGISYQINNTITASYLSNARDNIIKLSARASQRGLFITNNTILARGKIMKKPTTGFVTGLCFNNNTIKIESGNSAAYLVGVRDVGSVGKNSFINNHIDNFNPNTVDAVLDGEWQDSRVSNNTFYQNPEIPLFSSTSVTARSKLTSIPTDVPAGTNIPAGVSTLFYGTDGNLYYKSSAGVVTQLN